MAPVSHGTTACASSAFVPPTTKKIGAMGVMVGYQSTRHMVNSTPVNSSHTRLVTQSTRHITKPRQCRAVQFNYLDLMSLYHIARMISDNSYLWAWKLERKETLHIHVQHGKSLQRVQYRSHRRRRSSWVRWMLDQKVRSTRHNAVKHDGQLITRFYGVTSCPHDELIGSPTEPTRQFHYFADTDSPRVDGSVA